MAADTATASGRSLGSIYAAVDQLKYSAEALFKAYESDDPATTLSHLAMSIRIDASRLESTLDAVVAALDNLG